MLKVGVIGAGSMGRHHVRLYSELPQCELIGLADPDETRSELASSYKTQFFADHHVLLVKQPQLVSIAAPTSLHYKLTLDSLKAGCHVLLEKPVSDDLEHAEELVRQARARDLLLAVGHIERFNPAAVTLKRLIDAGELGEVLAVSNLRVGPYHGRIMDTGIVLDLGIHDVDLIQMLTGTRTERVFATALTRQHQHEDQAVLHLALADGRTGMVELSWNAPYRMRNILVSGTRRYAMCDLLNQRLMVYEEREESGRLLPQPYPVTPGEPLKAELESVIASVEEGSEPECRAEDSIHALKVCLAALRSVATREAVAIEG